jgi:beta-glucanase (GH16 family)
MANTTPPPGLTPPINASQLTFDDEFNSLLSSPNGNVGWMSSYQYQGESSRALPANGEAEYYSDSSVGVNPFSVSNGVLTITANPAAAGSNPYNMPYTSGALTSLHSLNQEYGYFEINAQLPSGAGLWPAFWLLPAAPTFSTELDVFEVLGQTPSTIYSTIHYDSQTGQATTAILKNIVNTSSGFNTYGVDWEPLKTTFYINGTAVAQMPTPTNMNIPMYMIMNLAVGAPKSWPGAPTSTSEFPAQMNINWVHAYATASTVAVSGTQAIKTSGVTGQVQLAGTGYGGVTVSLVDALGNVVATTRSDASGNYSFSKLSAGNYQVRITAPYGMNLASGAGISQTTGLTQVFNLSDGQTYAAPTETLAGPANPATIQSTVEFYGNTNALTAGTPESGVTVSLLVGGQVVGTTTTNSQGQYSFGQLPPGTYQVSYAPPAGQTIQPGTAADQATGITQSFTVAAGQTVTAPAGALISLASISGQVQTLSGAGDAGVTVSLLNSAGTVVGTATTTSTGAYSFGNLAAGTYQVKYAPPSGQVRETGSEASSATGLTPSLTVATGQALSVPTEVMLTSPATITGTMAHFGAATDPVWGGADPGIPVSLLNAAGQVIATTVGSAQGWYSFTNLAPGTYRVQVATPANQEFKPGSAIGASGLSAPITVAAGQTVAAPQAAFVSVATLQGQATLQGAGESGVGVQLIGAAGNVLASTTTDSSGNYAFTNLAAGTYEVAFATPTGQALQASASVNATTGMSTPVTLTLGQTTTMPAAVFAPLPATLAGTVAFTGSGAGSATISLQDASGNVLATTTPDSNGAFSFTGLAAGSYQVSYAVPSTEVLQSGPAATATGLTAPVTLVAGETLTLGAEVLAPAPSSLSGSTLYGQSGQAGVTVALLDGNGTALASTVSDSTGAFAFTGLAAGTYELSYTAPTGEILTAGPANSTTGITAPITLIAGQSLTVAPEILGAAPATLSGSVIYAGAAEAGVAVALQDTSGNIVATTVSASDGSFAFTGLAAGSYQLAYTAPSGQILQSGPAANASGLTQSVSLVAGQTLAMAAETLAPAPATVSGSVLYNGTAQAGVAVAVLDGSGTVVASTTSGADGSFSFTGLAAGSYQLQYTAPSGEMLNSGPAANATGLTPTLTLAAGQTLAMAPENLATALCSVAGSVTQAGTGQAGLAVSLLSASGTQIATTTTGSTGSFAFSGLAAGNYEVKYTAPKGTVMQTGGPATPSTGLTSVLPLAAGQNLTLAPEQLLTTPAMIQGVAYHFGGTNDPVYGGADPGVRVSLLNAAGSVIATTTSGSQGWYNFTNIGAGTYTVQYTAPTGQGVKAGTSATSAPITIATASGQSVWATPGSFVSTDTMNGTGLSHTLTGGGYVVTGNASFSTLTTGAGNQTVTLTGTNDTVTTGNGNQTITLAGTGNTVTVGTGSSTINAGTSGAVVHAAGGGTTTITAGGSGNLFDGGAGISFLVADGSTGNEFLLNGAGSSLMTTIKGFATTGDTLDLQRTLAGTNILPDLSNLSSYITAAATGANTTLYVDPTGGHGTAQAFAVLSGVHTTVAQLQAANAFSLS